MDQTEKFAEFLVRGAEKDGPGVLKNIDSFICSHFARWNIRGWELSSERERLAAAFIKTAKNNELTEAILERIRNAPFKSQ